MFKSPLLWICIAAVLLLGGNSKDGSLTKGGDYTYNPNMGGEIRNNDGTVTVKSTITKVKAKSIAEQLYHEFYMTLVTTDAPVLALFKGLNEADFAMIYDAFGVVGSGLFGFGRDKDLIEWCISDLSNSALKTLKKQFPEFF